MLNVQQIVQKWQNNLARSGEAVKAGVQNVTVAPGQKAAAAANKYAQNTQEAVNSGKFQRRVSAVSLTDWQNAMIQKGIPRLNTGAAAGAAKMGKYLTVAAPVYEDIRQTTANMPNNNTDEALAKVRVAMEKMKALGASLQ